MKHNTQWVTKDEHADRYWPSAALKKIAYVSDPKIYAKALKDPVDFWETHAKEMTWFTPWKTAYESKPPHFTWFVGGTTNICFNALDRHLATDGTKPALIWEPELPTEKPRVLTYRELHERVCKLANALKEIGVGKGDRVGVYLPMIPEVHIALLACARIGAVHTVVFSAFSAASLKDRLIDSDAKVLITADGYYRRGKVIDLKSQADAGCEGTDVKHVIVVHRIDTKQKTQSGRDLSYEDLTSRQSAKCDAVPMGSGDPLFILYTSGTTGKPKGIVHDTGGYMTQAYITTRWIFDLHRGDIFWCTADIGWITGHTYGCYGPFLNGATTVIAEGSPDFPDVGVWWRMIERHAMTGLYTSPTAIRMFEKAGDEFVKADLSSLRLIASVGEPIGHEAWMWYFNTIGGGRCPLLDTWWQTETGGILISSLPGIGPFVPTVAGMPFPGVDAVVLDDKGKPVSTGQEGFLALKPPFAPGMLHGVHGDDAKYRKTYWATFGEKIYDTSDKAEALADGLFKVNGRADDVMKVAGHRMSTAEIEDAVTMTPGVAECAVVSRPDDIKGEVPIAFVILKTGVDASTMKDEIKKSVDHHIGPIARPQDVYFVDDVPKTRSGKIMRRILKALLKHEDPGNITTLSNPECVEKIRRVVEG